MRKPWPAWGRSATGKTNSGDGGNGNKGRGGYDDDDDDDGDYDNAQTAVKPVKLSNVNCTPLDVTINSHLHKFLVVPPPKQCLPDT